MKVRRTPKLTKQCQALFEQTIMETGGWSPGETTREIAMETGLTAGQVADAIFGAASDEWRRAMIRRVTDARKEREMGATDGAHPTGAGV
jgi:hypothetical protein